MAIDRPTVLHLLFGADRGGCERDARVLIEAIPAASHLVGVLADTGPMAAEWQAVGAAVRVLGAQSSHRWRVAGAVRQFALEARPDAVMIWHGLVRLPQILWALEPLRVPIAVHGGNPAYGMSRRVDWMHEALHRLYPLRGPLPTYICCSQYVADSFEASRYLRRFPRVVVPNGVRLPPEGARHAPRPLRADEPATIGMVARLNSIKDHATLVRAMALVRGDFPNAVLELAGEGEERPRLERLARELGLGEAVRFLGELPNVYDAMARWDLFAYATTAAEGLGNAVSEAMMFSLPCVVTEVGPTREFAGDGAAVQLVPPADPEALAAAIVKLLPDLDARCALSAEASRLAASRYHPEAFARSHARVLRLEQETAAR